MKILVLLVLLSIIGCGSSKSEIVLAQKPQIPVFKSSNVEIQTEKIDTLFNPQTTISNNNEFSVTVLGAIRSSSHGYGHEPVWVKIIPAKECIYYCANPHVNADIFFIYRSGAGDLIGLINTKWDWHTVEFHIEPIKGKK